MRDDKYDLNQFKTDPWIPNQEDRRIRMSWSMVCIKCSRKVKKTRRQRQDSFCEPMAFIEGCLKTDDQINELWRCVQ